MSLKLAERGSWIGDKKSGLWVREVLPRQDDARSLARELFRGQADLTPDLE